MITRAEVARLGALHAVRPSVLSLYLAIPPDPGDLRGLPARADELIAAAQRAAGGHLREQDRASAREAAAACGPGWPGRGVAVFACAELGLLEAYPLPCYLRERAVLGIRPHVRPLLAVLQRCAGRQARPGGLPAGPPGSAVTGLADCLAAVSACAVRSLAVPEDGLVPGYECGRCGALTLDADGCPDWGTAALPVPDVIEEMVTRALEDGAEVTVTRDAPARFAARLSAPLAAAA